MTPLESGYLSFSEENFEQRTSNAFMCIGIMSAPRDIKGLSEVVKLKYLKSNHFVKFLRL